MTKRLDDETIRNLNATIKENDELVSTRYIWDGDYAFTIITLRKYSPVTDKDLND